ncbi:hypothetical protein [Pelagicoccus sp. SDUM812003]|uniref:hypothetical protein n=1 Tax=Pelagicoccus sp. SDUM812003 TaxID=3041267 RepID=UPI00280FB8E6|nr:hypothetical protein [Pelagicoccus sp. SDUM812003]MDQ8203415.1 hypothetical protein [Pelagicoccus sp. SDUM812003]
MKNIRTLVASLATLAILMPVASLLGKSLEGFVPPLIVWLLLAIGSFRNSRSSSNCL